MAFTKNSTKNFHRKLYAGILETITLKKREDDQNMGTVRSVTIFECWQDPVQHTGEPIAGSMAAQDSTTWSLPLTQLQRAGVNYINADDVVVDSQGREWQPEGSTTITQNLFENYVHVACRRLK